MEKYAKWIVGGLSGNPPSNRISLRIGKSGRGKELGYFLHFSLRYGGVNGAERENRLTAEIEARAKGEGYIIIS